MLGNGGKPIAPGKPKPEPLVGSRENPLVKNTVPNESTQNGALATMRRGSTWGNPVPWGQPTPLLGDEEKHNISVATVSYDLGRHLNCINCTCVSNSLELVHILLLPVLFRHETWIRIVWEE